MEYNLKRFLDAQDDIYNVALAELSRGKKTTHWMWFIFPQIAGLGKTETAQFYAIVDINEAKLYYEHPTLGNRLVTCCEALLSLNENNPSKIFGSPDDLKLKSCMTLFAIATGDLIFESVLQQYYNAEHDIATLALLKIQSSTNQETGK